MFGFGKDKKLEEAREYASHVRPHVEKLLRAAKDPAIKGPIEMGTSVLFCWLCREKMTWRRIEPYLGEIMLDKMIYFNGAKTDRRKWLDYMHAGWAALKEEEDKLRSKGKPILEGLLAVNLMQNLVEERVPGYLDELKNAINDLISYEDLTYYQNHKFTTQPRKPERHNDSPRYVTLTAPGGGQTRFRIMDVIPFGGKEYACLLGEGEELLTILEMQARSDGQTGYVSVHDDLTQVIFEQFCKRNPNLVG